MITHIDFCDYKACDIIVHYSKSEENFSSLRELFISHEDGELSGSKTKTDNCKAILRSDLKFSRDELQKM
jgi:hypothetical protein